MSKYSGVTPGPGSPRVADAEQVEAARAAMPPDGAVSQLADVFALLCDPGRLRLIVALLDAELCVGDLAATAGLSESAASHALRILRAHRVVSSRRSGRMVFYRLADAHVRLLLEVALAHVAHEAPDGPRAPHDGKEHADRALAERARTAQRRAAAADG